MYKAVSRSFQNVLFINLSLRKCCYLAQFFSMCWLATVRILRHSNHFNDSRLLPIGTRTPAETITLRDSSVVRSKGSIAAHSLATPNNFFGSLQLRVVSVVYTQNYPFRFYCSNHALLSISCLCRDTSLARKRRM